YRFCHEHDEVETEFSPPSIPSAQPKRQRTGAVQDLADCPAATPSFRTVLQAASPTDTVRSRPGRRLRGHMHLPRQPMKRFAILLATLFLAPLTLALAQPKAGASAQTTLNMKRDIPYAEPADPRQKVDIYGPAGAKNLPVVFWFHGRGSHAGARA